MSKPTLATRLMNEVIIYGGLPMRRCDVYTLAAEHLGSHARDRFGADWFAFGPYAKVVDMEPWTLAEAREIMR